jgi:Xaa-Pro dipeptidase
MAEHDVDALLVCGSEYSGFEGAGALPVGLSDRASLRLRAAAARRRSDDDLPERGALGRRPRRRLGRRAGLRRAPGAWIRDHLRATASSASVGLRARLRHARARLPRARRSGPFELVDFDVAFDLSRAVKSDEELALVRESMAINEAGFWAVHEAYEPGARRPS